MQRKTTALLLVEVFVEKKELRLEVRATRQGYIVIRLKKSHSYPRKLKTPAISDLGLILKQSLSIPSIFRKPVVVIFL